MYAVWVLRNTCRNTVKFQLQIYLVKKLNLHILDYSWNTILPPLLQPHCFVILHDDVIKWKYFPRYWPFVPGIHRSPVNSPQKGQWRGTLMFSLIWARINCWVNNREAGDLRSNRTHYDVIIIKIGPDAIPAPIYINVLNLKWVIFRLHKACGCLIRDLDHMQGSVISIHKGVRLFHTPLARLWKKWKLPLVMWVQSALQSPRIQCRWGFPHPYLDQSILKPLTPGN